MSDKVVKVWEVWMEGYQVTGNKASASFKGVFEGETFKDAVCAYADTLDSKTRTYFNSDYSAFWGCKFYDNETDARGMFG